MNDNTQLTGWMSRVKSPVIRTSYSDEEAIELLNNLPKGFWYACCEGNCSCGTVWNTKDDIPILVAANLEDYDKIYSAENRQHIAKFVAAAPILVKRLLKEKQALTSIEKEIKDFNETLDISILNPIKDNSFFRITHGVNRIVVLIGELAIKFPNPIYGMEYFVSGMYANIRERKFWKNHPNHKMAKSYFVFILGLFLICKRYRTLATKKLSKAQLKQFPFIELDNNGNNFAVQNNDIVVLDYGGAGTMWIGFENET